MIQSASLGNFNINQIDNNLVANESNIFKNSFNAKNDFIAYGKYCTDRSKNSKLLPKKLDTLSIWERKPVDFTWKLYQPKPPKRNTREAIKPWQYDKYLKPIDLAQVLTIESKYERSDESFGNQFLAESLNKAFNLNQDSMEFKEFSAYFRPLSPLKAKIEASKSMSYREGLDQYNGLVKFPLRELKRPSHLPDFECKNDKDPYSLKFRSQNLNQITGPPIDAVVRDIEAGEQMGDLSKFKQPRYEPNLILPQLKFPSKYNCYTRFKNMERTPQAVYWDRVLPQINKEWQEEKKKSNQ